MNLFAKIGQAIPANKFQPPRLAAERILKRDEVFKSSFKTTLNPRIIYLEAQAGQGKTTLAIQYLERIKSPYCWYQAGEEDQDPILFISALLVALTKSVPPFSSPLLIKKLEDGEVSMLELHGCLNILLHDLAAFLDNELIIVIDDLHLLENSQVTVSLLDHLLSTAPEPIRFLLASRRSLPLKALSSAGDPGVLLLNNKALALSRIETMELIQEVMKVSVSWEMVEKIHQRTAGWVMGLILAGQSLAVGNDQFDTISEGSIGDYFRRVIIGQLPKDLQTQLVRLSFLNEIEISLAEQVTGMDDIGERLSELMERNYFVRSLDKGNQVFAFHHFFQDFLQQLGREQLGQTAINDVLNLAAAYNLEKGRIGQSLTYHLKAGQFHEIETLLRLHGMELLARNQNITLIGIFSSIPKEIMGHSPWLTLYASLAVLDQDPETAFPLLSKAFAMFVEQGDDIGELLAGSQILYCHFCFTALYEEGAQLLPRIYELYDKVSEKLPLYAKILVAKNIAMTTTVMTGDFAMSHRFSDIALKLSQRHRIYNFTATTLISRGFNYLFTTQLSAAIATAEQAYDFLHHEHVSMINRMSLAIYLHNLADGLGDIYNVRQYKAFMVGLFGSDFFYRTLFGVIVKIWDIALAIAEDHLSEARALLHQGREMGATARNPHMQSQFLHWQAYIAALEGNESEACKAAEESLRLRKISGSPLFIIINRLILGMAYTLLERWQEAEELLNECIELSGQFNALAPHAFGHLYRGYLKLQKNGPVAARDDLAQGLSLMRKNNLIYFFSWSPQIMKPLLQTAVREGIESDYAEKLARERLDLKILPNGEMFPLLNIQVLGGFTLKLEGKVICRGDELTPSQRQLLAILFSSRDQCSNLDTIQLNLWPDSAPNKARNALDSQISRLRKFLGDRCKPYNLKNYLVVGKGLVKLQNSRIDAMEFIDLARKGLTHSRQEQWWQASNYFSAALAFWKQGSFGSEFFGIDEAEDLSFQLKSLLTESAITWGHHLKNTGRLNEALRVIELAWYNNSLSTELVKTLFALHLHSNDITAAHNVLKHYAGILGREGYEEDEIEELCQDISAHI